MKLTLDFETANTKGVDLDRVGAEVYARHPATEVLCLCVMDENGEPLHTWRPGDSDEWLFNRARTEGIIFEAHNAAFEQMIWKHIMVARYGLPAIPIQRWSCTMARSYAHGMPGGLEPLARVLDLPEQKDKEGSKLTYGLSDPITKKAWSTPVSAGGWRPDDWTGTQKAWAETYKPIFDRRPVTLERVTEYCMQDCRTEWFAGLVLPELSPYERRVWEYDQLINQRGVKIDKQFVNATIQILEDAKDAALTRFAELTGGLRPKQVEKLKGWLAEHGLPMENLAAATVDKILGGDADAETGVVLRDGKLPPDVHEVLSIRRLLSASAIDKFPRMFSCAGPDDRARYTLQYHGAGPGRWAGRLFQPQNFPRSSIPDFEDATRNLDPEVAVAAFLTGDYRFVEDLFGKSAIWCAGRVIRHALIADEGRVYSSADFAGIEMRIDLALAGQADKCELLRLNDTGEKPVDVYLDMAEDIYNTPKGQWTPPDKDALKKIKEAQIGERTIGKNTVLGCGFGMGADTFQERYCKEQPLSFAQGVIRAYREDWAPKVKALWFDLENTALRAVQDRGREHTTACGVTYVYPNDQDWLILRLPDGQRMWYREPRLCTGRFGNPAWQFKTWKDGRWQTIDAYGGLLTENVCQKLARGLLCEAINRLETNGWPVVLTVHDEILAEPLKGADHKAFEQIMAERPKWAAHLPAPVPIAVEGWQGPRYRK